ncbi:RHS repeat-associated core domain-containing protein [Candidatus Bathyarchaeota archaeon]|nr:MAG: RHS repeat-associated core domain-containing protein [Candidatus Bathyarchaeota archaeon]
MTDPRGNITSYGYSSKYQSAYLTSLNETLAPGGTLISSYSYNFTTGTMLSTVDPDGYNTTYLNDVLGRVKQVIYPTRDYANYTYNDAGNYVNVTNENGWLTQQRYDGLGRLSSLNKFQAGSLYSTQTYTHDWQNKIVTDTDPLGNRITYQYDPLGRTTQVTKPDGNTTAVTYNDLSSWTRTSDENGVGKCSTVDRLGRLVSVVENATSSCSTGIVTNYNYDELGNLAKTTTANLKSTTYVYDNLNRLTKTSYPDATSETYAYDNNGNLVLKIDRKNVQTTNNFDSLNRVTTKTFNGPAATTDRYSYDPNGNLIQLQNQNTTVQYGYDSRNRVTSETYAVGNPGFALSVSPPSVNLYCTPTQCTPTSATATLTVTSVLGFSGTVALSYLPPGSGTGGTSLSGSSSVSLTSGGRAQVTLTATLGTLTGNYVWTIQAQGSGKTALLQFTISEYVCHTNCPQNPAGGSSPSGSSPLSPSTGSEAYIVGYGYKGEVLANMTYPDGLVAKYGYDGLGRISNVTSPGSTSYATFTYDRNDRVQGILFGNSLYASYTYDRLSRPSQIVLTGSTTLLSLAYSYNRTGTLAAVTGQVNQVPVSEHYRYDPLGRIINAVVGSNNVTNTLSYQYDSLGNRLSQSLNGQATTYLYNATNNELKSLTGPGGSISYTYDANGNLLTRGIGSTNWAYSWDPSNNLVSVANNGITQGQYVYDGSGRRLESAETSTVYYAYHGTETLSELASNGATTDYIYGGGMMIAKVSAATVNYYHFDALGSTRLVTTFSATVVFSDNYQPYGQDNGTPYGSDTYKFTGKPYSAATGLYYYFHRWYDPTIGRFISLDPKHGRLSNPQSLNLYIYVRDIPTILTDPTGEGDSFHDRPYTPQGPGLTQAQQAQLFTILVIVVAVVAIVATGGIASPVAAGIIIGASLGASVTTTVYTVTKGDKATLAGAVGSAVTGAIAGAIGGGAGAGLSTVVGALATGGGSVLGDIAGRSLEAGLGGRQYDLQGQETQKELILGAGVSLVTFGLTSGFDSSAGEAAAESVLGPGPMTSEQLYHSDELISPYVFQRNMNLAFLGTWSALLGVLLPNYLNQW